MALSYGGPSRPEGLFLAVISGSDGREIQPPTNLGVFRGRYRAYTTPAVGDLDGNGDLDVAFQLWDNLLVGVNGKTCEVAWKYPTDGENMGGVDTGDLDAVNPETGRLPPGKSFQSASGDDLPVRRILQRRQPPCFSTGDARARAQ